MTILVSRTWPLDPSAAHLPSREGVHPHLDGRGSGNAYTYPDEMWATAKRELEHLALCPGGEIKYEWVRGYPSGYALLEGAVCSLDAHPEDFLPELHVSPANPRRWIGGDPLGVNEPLSAGALALVDEMCGTRPTPLAGLDSANVLEGAAMEIEPLVAIGSRTSMPSATAPATGWRHAPE